MKDKRIIEPLLRAFKNGDVDFEYTVNYILDVYSNSKRFNWNNFGTGMCVGGLLGIIAAYLST